MIDDKIRRNIFGVLELAAEHAKYLETLPNQPITPMATVAELRRRLAKSFPEPGIRPEEVIDELVHDAEDGILRSSSGRFFVWVIGGTLPVAIAADWLTSTWDQNAASNMTAPAEAVVEEVCGKWTKELLGIPPAASFALVTGCQMAHTVALASARHKLLQDRGWDVEKQGLAGAPQLRILTTEARHKSIIRSARLLGIGTDAVEYVSTDDTGCMSVDKLAEALQQSTETPVTVCLQAGDLKPGFLTRLKRPAGLLTPPKLGYMSMAHSDCG